MNIIPFIDNVDINIFDAFSGIGAFSVAGLYTGCNPLLSLDFSKVAHKIYTSYFKKTKTTSIQYDIYNFVEYFNTCYDSSDISSNEFDFLGLNYSNLKQLLESIAVLTAGYPCQDNSRLNHNKDRNSKRSKAYRPILKLIKKINPKMIIFENVISVDPLDINEIVFHLKRFGYNVLYQKFNDLSHYGAFQTRARLFIIALKGKAPALPKYSPNKIPIGSILEDISAISEFNTSKEKYAYAFTQTLNHWFKFPNQHYNGNAFNIDPEAYSTKAVTNPTKNYYFYRKGNNIRLLIIREFLALFGFDKAYNMFYKDPFQLKEVGQAISNTIPTQFLINLMIENFKVLYPDKFEKVVFDNTKIFPTNFNSLVNKTILNNNKLNKYLFN